MVRFIQALTLVCIHISVHTGHDEKELKSLTTPNISDAFYKRRKDFVKKVKEKSGISGNKVVLLYTPNVQLTCKTMEKAMKVQWLYQEIDGSFMIQTIADNDMVRMPHIYAVDESINNQHSLIIRNATMDIAGTYSCLVSYSTLAVKSFVCEVNVITLSRSVGSVLTPLMYFKWELIYAGKMKPFFKCSNGRSLMGLKKNFSLNFLIFSSCFLPENLPNYCVLYFRDAKNKPTLFKRYWVRLVEEEGAEMVNRTVRMDEYVVVKHPKDVILNINGSLNAELQCQMLPPPHAIVWAFLDSKQRCYRFENMSGHASEISQTSLVHRINKKNNFSSQINFVKLGYSSAGQLRCLAIYNYKRAFHKTLTAEIVVVAKVSEFVEMNVLKDVSQGKEVMVRYVIYYTGNPRPNLICVNKRFVPKEIRKEEATYRVNA